MWADLIRTTPLCRIEAKEINKEIVTDRDSVWFLPQTQHEWQMLGLKSRALHPNFPFTSSTLYISKIRQMDILISSQEFRSPWIIISLKFQRNVSTCSWKRGLICRKDSALIPWSKALPVNTALCVYPSDNPDWQHSDVFLGSLILNTLLFHDHVRPCRVIKHLWLKKKRQ